MKKNLFISLLLASWICSSSYAATVVSDNWAALINFDSDSSNGAGGGTGNTNPVAGWNNYKNNGTNTTMVAKSDLNSTSGTKIGSITVTGTACGGGGAGANWTGSSGGVALPTDVTSNSPYLPSNVGQAATESFWDNYGGTGGGKMTITFSGLASGWYSLDILSARGNGNTSGEMSLSSDANSISYWTRRNNDPWVAGDELTNTGSLSAFGAIPETGNWPAGKAVYAQFNQFYVDESGIFSLIIKSNTGYANAAANMMVLRSVSPSVPEPSTAFLGLLGMGMMAFRRRRSISI